MIPYCTPSITDLLQPSSCLYKHTAVTRLSTTIPNITVVIPVGCLLDSMNLWWIICMTAQIRDGLLVGQCWLVRMDDFLSCHPQWTCTGRYLECCLLRFCEHFGKDPHVQMTNMNRDYDINAKWSQACQLPLLQSKFGGIFFWGKRIIKMSLC